MTIAHMREHLIAYLLNADGKKIKGLYSLLEDNIQKDALIDLSKDELDFVNRERNKHLNGESKSYNWEEVKDLIRKRKAS